MPSPLFMSLPDLPLVPPLPDSAIRDLAILQESSECGFPCWNGLTPGHSGTSEIPAFLARLGIDPASLQETDGRLPQAPHPSREVAALIDYDSVASDYGLSDVSVFWDPTDGKVEAIFFDYDKPPSAFNVRSLFTNMGRPEEVLMQRAGQGGYRLVFAFPQKGALVMVSAMPREWPQLCLTNDEFSDPILAGPAVVLFEPAGDPLRFAEWIAIPEELADTSVFAGLSQQEFVDALSSSNGCVTLIS